MTDWFDGAGNGAQCDVVGMLDGSQAGKGIAELVAAGALVSMGTTSDGGALGVTVTVDGRWRREYFREVDDLLVWIAAALPAVHSARGSAMPPAGKAPRQRRSRGL
jgi:hypothetical protein